MSPDPRDANASDTTAWDLPVPLLLARLGTAPEGLDVEVATARRAAAAGGPGRRRVPKVVVDLGRAFSDPLLLLLAGAAAVSAAVDAVLDAAVVLVMVAMTGLLSFVQTYRSERAIEELARLVPRTVTVRRGGRARDVPVDDLVVGDVIEVGQGDLIPGDARLLASRDLLVDESALTGEPFPVAKRVAEVVGGGPLLARRDVLLEGSHVESGAGTAVIIAVGRSTELGRLAGSVATLRGRTAFQRGTVRLGAMLTRTALGIAAVTMLAGAAVGRPLLDVGMFALALVVGLAPEMLPGILLVSLAAGARRMAARRVIVRRLDAIEDVGGLEVLCVDKTGTLTEGEVRLDGAWDCDGRPSDAAAALAAVAARTGGRPGDPIDDALAAAAPDAPGRAVALVAFDFRRRRASVLVDVPEGRLLVVKGALASVLDVCETVRTSAGDVPVAAGRGEVERLLRRFGAEGRRVLGVATRALPDATDVDVADERGLVLRGLVTLSDAPKPDARAAVERLRDLGVDVVMLTGDNRYAAGHVATAVGIDHGAVVTGDEVAALDAVDLTRRVRTARVFAELDPTTKDRVVAALQRTGRTVGYLGDGVNDVAALRRADVGLSVDTATQVAREASDLILLDKDLDVVAEGVRLGRRTFANTVKYVLTTMAANLGNVTSIAVATLFLPFLPLLPRQILLLNLLSDVPSLALAGDRVDDAWVARPVRWDLGRIRGAMLRFGLLSSAFDLVLFILLLTVLRVEAAAFRSAWFVGSVLTEVVALIVLRTAGPALRSRPSPVVLGLTLAAGAGAIVLPELPVLADPMGLVPLRGATLATVVGVVTAYAAASEVTKRRVLARSPMGR